MIDRQKEFKENLEVLKTEANISYDQGFPKQKEIMDSLKLNESMKNIEIILNGLYEKTRALEDAMGYAQTFLREEIFARRQSMQTRMSEIEVSRDAMKESSYRAKVITLTKKRDRKVRDRDGTVLPTCGISNNLLTLSGQVLESIRPVSLSRKIVNQSNGESIELGESSRYMTSYAEEQLISGGIREEITFAFNGVQSIGTLEMTPMNCSVVEIAFVNKNDVEEIVPQSELYTFQPVEAKGVRATILCRSPETVNMLKQESGRSAWEINGDLKESFLYERDATSSIAEADEDRANRAYLKLQEDLKDKWQIERNNEEKAAMKEGLGRS